jgi:hypothetical protein
MAPARAMSTLASRSGSSWTLSAEPLGERDERPQLCHARGIPDRDVHGALDQRTVAEGDDLARDVDGHAHLRLARVGAEVRRDDHPGVLDQPADHLAPGRLLGPDVDRRAGDVAGIECLQEIALVHDAAPRLAQERLVIREARAPRSFAPASAI